VGGSGVSSKVEKNRGGEKKGGQAKKIIGERSKTPSDHAGEKRTKSDAEGGRSKPKMEQKPKDEVATLGKCQKNHP